MNGVSGLFCHQCWNINHKKSGKICLEQALYNHKMSEIDMGHKIQVKFRQGNGKDHVCKLISLLIKNCPMIPKRV